MDFIRPDQPSKCTWTPTADPSTSPHTKVESKPREKILDNVCHVIGQTPMVRLNSIPKKYGIQCEMLAKCEFFNPGGSVKDRIGYRMVEDAEKKGILKPGYTIIEPTSGNTGIGLAMASAVKGYRCIIVMPQKMSTEKVDILRCLGAEIIRTPTEAAFDSPEGLIAVSQRIQKETPNSVILDQYRNAGNPLAHYDNTAEEILAQCDGKIDMVVCGAGTGGTICGIGRKIKEKYPDCIVVGADPEGSVLAEPESLNETDVSFYEVEGIGYDFIPTVLDRSVVDRWYKSNDREALPMARKLIRQEGLLCGGSSGTAMSVALKAAADLREDQRCVVLLPDGVRNYMTKLVSDQWMEARNLKVIPKPQLWWWESIVSQLHHKPLMYVGPEATCLDAFKLMSKEGLNQLPIANSERSLFGMVTLRGIMDHMVNGSFDPNESVTKVMSKQFVKITMRTSVGRLSRILEKDPFVVVINQVELDKATGLKTPEHIICVLEHVDVLNFITTINERGDAIDDLQEDL